MGFDIKDGLRIYCMNQEEARSVLTVLHNAGYGWANGSSLLEADEFDKCLSRIGITYTAYDIDPVNSNGKLKVRYCPGKAPECVSASYFLAGRDSSVYIPEDNVASDEELFSLLGVSSGA